MGEVTKNAQVGIKDPKQVPLRDRKKRWNRELYIQFKQELKQFKNVLNGKDPITGQPDPNRRIQHPFPPDVSQRLEQLSDTYRILMQEASGIIQQQGEYSRVRRKSRRDMLQTFVPNPQEQPVEENPFAAMKAASFDVKASWWGSRRWQNVKSLLPWGERQDARIRATLLRTCAVFENKLQTFEDKILSTGNSSVPEGFYAFNEALQFYIKLAEDFSKYLKLDEVSDKTESKTKEEKPKEKTHKKEKVIEPLNIPELLQPQISLTDEQKAMLVADKEIIWGLIHETFSQHPAKSQFVSLINKSLFSPSKSLIGIENNPEKMAQLLKQHEIILNIAKQMAAMPEAKSLTDVYNEMKERLAEVGASSLDSNIQKLAYKTTTRMLKRLLLGLVSNLSENDIIVVKTEISKSTTQAIDTLDDVMNLLEKDNVAPSDLMDEFYNMSENLYSIAKSMILLGKNYNEKAQSHNINVQKFNDRFRVISLTHIRYLMEYERKIAGFIQKFKSDNSSAADDGQWAMTPDPEVIRDNLSDLVESGDV